jgi:hypothetical protein
MIPINNNSITSSTTAMKFLILAATVLVINFSNVYACSVGCGGPFTLVQWFLGSAVVFEGKIVSVSVVNSPCTTYGTYSQTYFFTFEVKKSWKGVTSNQVVIQANRAILCTTASILPICGSLYDFFDDFSMRRYPIVFAQNYGGVLSSTLCFWQGLFVYAPPFNSIQEYLDSLARITTSAHQNSEQIATSSVKLFPNPSRDITTLYYNLQDASNVSAELFDVQGRSVQIIAPPEYQTAGNHYLQVDVRNLASGIYICRLCIGNKTIVRQVAVTA